MLAVQTKAFKEWAITIQALNEGRQILLLRKGGIYETGGRFQVSAPEFFLYPTLEHQRADLLKPEYQPRLARLLTECPSDGKTVTLSHFARVTDVFQVTEPTTVKALAPYHIWSDAYAEVRLHWKPRTPVYVMLLRVYRLTQPQTQAVLPEYAGCTSWLDMATGLSLEGMTPVLSDEEYEERTRQIRETLGVA